jgi:hypothetical protein
VTARTKQGGPARRTRRKPAAIRGSANKSAKTKRADATDATDAPVARIAARLVALRLGVQAAGTTVARWQKRGLRVIQKHPARSAIGAAALVAAAAVTGIARRRG